MQKIGSWVLLAALAVGTVYFFWFWPGRAALAAFSPVRSGGQTLVLDAGHGGEDGGAVSLSGVPESGINLAIVQKLDQLLGLYGEAPLLLRSEDISLHDDSAQTLREKKVSDLHNRVARIEETEHAVLLRYTRIPFRTGSTTALRCSIPTESSVNLWHNSHRRHCGPHWTRATPVRQSPSRTASI